MKTILVFVSTLDGKITKWGSPHVKSWSSGEDKVYFEKIWNSARLIILGSNTYNLEPIKPDPNNLLVIMTRQPLKYKDSEVPGQIEFRNETPAGIIKRYENEGYENMLVAGGPHLATSFLKEQLIDEFWLTIEPKIFGTGGNFVIEEKLDIKLQLLSSERANKQGTLFTKYSVMKNNNLD